MDFDNGRRRILLLSDARSRRAEVRATLHADGIPVVECTLQEAEAGLAVSLAGIVVIAAMPDAAATVRTIRSIARHRTTPVMLITPASPDVGHVEEVYALGAVDVLDDAVSPALLVAKARGMVALTDATEIAWQEAEQLHMIVQGTKDYAIFMLDPRGHVASWNAGAALLKGYREDEILGRHFSVFYPPDVVASGWVEHELLVATAEGRFEDEGWRVRKDGSRFWANVVISALRDGGGTLRGFAKVTRDLTSRKHAEEAARRLAEETAARRAAESHAAALAEQRERLRVTLASIGDGVITTDAAGRVEFMNPVAEALMGWTTQEAAGRPLPAIFNIVNERTRQPVENPALRCLAEGAIVGLANHTILISREGTERPIDDSAAPIRDIHGDVIGSVLVFRDVSVRRHTEKQRNVRASAVQALATADTDEEGTQAVLSALGTHMEWDVAGFWAVDAKGARLHCKASWAANDAALSEFLQQSGRFRFASGEGLPGRVWTTGQPAWIVDLASDPGFKRAPIATAAGLRSAFASPVMIGDRFAGVLEFLTRRREEPDPDLLEMITTVASVFAHFLHRRRAEAELREQTAVAEALARVGNRIAQEPDLHQLVQLVTDEATQLCAAQFGAFFYNVIGESGEAYTLYTLSGVPREAFADFPMPRNTALFGPTFRGQAIMRIDDVGADPRYGLSAPHHGMPAGHLPVRSYLAAAVVSRSGEVHGGLFFGHAEPGVFTERHERLLMGIAGQAAVAIDNARLYRSVQTSAERLNLALSAAGLGDWSWDAKTDLVTLSERAAAIFGIPTSPRLTWTAMQSLLHVADRERARSEVERVIAERTSYDIEYRVVHSDGSEVWAGALGRAHYDANGQVTGMHGVLQDITERKDLERSLRDSEARFRSLMEQAPFSVQVFSPDGRTLRVNRSWEALWGLRLEDLAEYNILDDAQLERHGVSNLLRGAFAGMPAFIPAVRYDPRESVPDKSHDRDPVRWVAAVAYPIRDADGTVQEVVLVHDDVTARRRAEAAMEESEAKLQLLADTIPQLAWMSSADGTVIWRNLRWNAYFNATSESNDADDWRARVHPDSAAEVRAAWQHSLATGEPFDMIFPLQGVTGDYQVFLTRVNPLRDDAGRIVHWIGTATDITELRRTRAALSASEERLRLALDAGRMGVWDWDVRTGELQWSDSLEPLHGLAQGQFGGTFEHFQQLIHPDDRAQVGAAIQKALDNRSAFYTEFRNVWPDGSLHWVAGSGKVFADDSGAAVRMIGIGLDVTERRRAEQTAQFLAAASVTLSEIADFDSTLQKVASLAVPAFADWAAVDIVESDDALRRVAVAHQDEAKVALAHEYHRRWPPQRSDALGAWHVVLTGEAEMVPVISDYMLAQSAKDDDALHVLRSLGLRSYIGVPLTLRGRTRGVLTFVVAESGHVYDEKDLALARELAHRTAIAIENAELYEELREADRRKDEFLATLAHELRNPLAPIRNGMSVMRLAGQERPEIAQVQSMMERQVQHLVRLVDDLLDVSRITRNRLELRLEPVALGDVVHSATETSRPLIEQFDHSLSVSLPDEPVHLYADRVRLAQVFSNLLNNAAKYTPPGGSIVLEAWVAEHEIVVRVRDNGIGIAPDALSRVFEMFAQIDHSAGNAQGGLGIGLTLVKRLVEMHDGTIEARSAGKGLGSEFLVRLPVRSAVSRAASRERPGQTPSTAPRRILVVDDNRDAAETMRLALEMLGSEVRLCFDGPEVVRAARSFCPDVVLLDIGLPSLSGYEVCRALRAESRTPQPYIVALTGWGQDSDRRRSREAGFDAHLVKPIDIDVLVDLLAGNLPVEEVPD